MDYKCIHQNMKINNSPVQKCTFLESNYKQCLLCSCLNWNFTFQKHDSLEKHWLLFLKTRSQDKMKSVTIQEQAFYEVESFE